MSASWLVSAPAGTLNRRLLGACLRGICLDLGLDVPCDLDCEARGLLARRVLDKRFEKRGGVESSACCVVLQASSIDEDVIGQMQVCIADMDLGTIITGFLMSF
jgi:hypothetical protein